MNSDRVPERKDEISFEDMFSADAWRRAVEATLNYFNDQKPLLTVIGFSIAISGLFLSVDSPDIYMRRVQAFFLTTTILLLMGLFAKSLFVMHRNKLGRIYGHITMILTYACILLLTSLVAYLKNNFATELLFYFQWTFIPFLALLVHLAFVAYFKLISRIRKIEGTQLRTFFLFSLDLNLLWVYISSNFDLVTTLEKMFAPTPNNLSLLALLCLSTLSELWPFTEMRKPRDWVIDLLIAVVALAGFLTILGISVMDLVESGNNIINLLRDSV